MQKKGHLQDSCISLVPIFANLTEEEMLEVAYISKHKKYSKNDMIYMEGDMGDNLYVVHEGQIKITRLSESGKEQVIRILGPGEFMGELSIFSGKPVNDYAQSLGDSNVCIVDGQELKELMKKYPSITFKVMAELSQRLEKVEESYTGVNLHSVESRIAKRLLELADEFNEITLPISKADLASQLGITQETLSRKLTAFADERLIKQIGHRRIIILKPKSLRQYIEE